VRELGTRAEENGSEGVAFGYQVRKIASLPAVRPHRGIDSALYLNDVQILN
jgi:hypothetical protein